MVRAGAEEVLGLHVAVHNVELVALVDTHGHAHGCLHELFFGGDAHRVEGAVGGIVHHFNVVLIAGSGVAPHAVVAQVDEEAALGFLHHVEQRGIGGVAHDVELQAEFVATVFHDDYARFAGGGGECLDGGICDAIDGILLIYRDLVYGTGGATTAAGGRISGAGACASGDGCSGAGSYCCAGAARDGCSGAAGDGCSGAAGDGCACASGDGCSCASGDGCSCASGDGCSCASGDGCSCASGDGCAGISVVITHNS